MSEPTSLPDNVVDTPAATNTVHVMGSPVDIKKALEAHYKRSFGGLELRMGEQIMDGSIVEFVDTDLKVPVASGRLRFTNNVATSSEGELFLKVKISDVTHGPNTIAIATTQ
jgi:hypothetical protein